MSATRLVADIGGTNPRFAMTGDDPRQLKAVATFATTDFGAAIGTGPGVSCQVPSEAAAGRRLPAWGAGMSPRQRYVGVEAARRRLNRMQPQLSRKHPTA